MTSDRAEDLALVRRCLAGDSSAYGGLVDRYQRPIYGLALRILGEQGPAEEITQETFIRAYTKLSTFDQKRKFSSWLFRIAHNASIDELRRRRLRTVPIETGPDDERVDLLQVLAEQKSADPERRASASALQADIEDVIASLRPEYAEVMVLRFIEDLSYDEIVEVMDLPLGTVKTYIHRARRQAANELSRRGWGSGEEGSSK